MLADYSQMNGLDLVMVHCFCSSAQGANKSIPSTPWYSEDALIALSAARFIKAPWLSLHVTDSTFLNYLAPAGSSQVMVKNKGKGSLCNPLVALRPSITAVRAAVLSPLWWKLTPELYIIRSCDECTGFSSGAFDWGSGPSTGSIMTEMNTRKSSVMMQFTQKS